MRVKSLLRGKLGVAGKLTFPWTSFNNFQYSTVCGYYLSTKSIKTFQSWTKRHICGSGLNPDLL